MRHSSIALLGLITALGAPVPARAQDSNVFLEVADIEQRLSRDSMQVLEIRGSRAITDRTYRATVTFPDSAAMIVKFAAAPVGGNAFNNSPRYEVAAYEFQKLFLSEPDYVVPPTLMRVFDLEWYRRLNTEVPATFGGAASVVAVLQYWLANVSPDSAYNPRRFERDSVYARHFGDLNLLTYLIRHNDSNTGNVLISTESVNPRVFSVDNGLSFGLEESDRGTLWQNLRVDRLPARTIERLRTVTRADLDRTLEVIAEFEIQGARLVPVERTANINRGAGVRRRDARIQFGLTGREIDGVEGRIARLLRRVDSGDIRTF